jgi:RNA polymerase sigma factor (sigma-70 family)
MVSRGERISVSVEWANLSTPLRPAAPCGWRPAERPDFASLVNRALDGDSTAWDGLVDGLKRVAWKAIGAFDLQEDERKDAFASTFFLLFERLATVREPEKLPGWIATTARREASAVSRARRRLVPTAELPTPADGTPDVLAEGLIDGELHVALRRALERLEPSCRELLLLLMADPPLTYEEVGDVLGLPHGSIGPTRARCLAKLRATPELAPFLDGGAR